MGISSRRDGPVDPIAAAFFWLPELGMPPRPGVEGLSRPAARVVIEAAPQAWRYAGDWLGTNYALESFTLVERLGRQAPDLIRRGKPVRWARACVWAVGHRYGLIGQDCGLDVPNLSRELDAKPHYLNRDAAAIREVIDQNWHIPLDYDFS
ncbi:hypothetical protein IU501_21490 [Nocardia otitidiscaviarum]|uniref:hypothetical protein n=1 Tax=Nocardia otitidiscaviarum TaxID=1823 RepID=UPI0004A7246A|nr:hypothetical protein [Nocardia otitidiscaviarum]MBF6135565.1 hypothetical protein [Nocardia otitidiscaviarum]MBF6487382.1 hypothetical protein [Nocardia otitidiscaviarum]